MKGHIVKINDKEYKIICQTGIPQKFHNSDKMGVALKIAVIDVETNEELKWQELKGTYIAEKVSDWAENSFNGQNTFYWSSSEGEK